MAVLVQGASRGIGLALCREFAKRGKFPVVFAGCRQPDALASLLDEAADHVIRPIRIDLDDEGSIKQASDAVKASEHKLSIVINASGLLHDDAIGMQPERRFEEIDSGFAARSFQINTIGPMLMAKHFAPQLLRRGEATMFASISARVGSIGDNVMGGWYSYRASKAAQNQFTKTLSIELQRRSKGGCAVIGLHPGTVRTALSAPFAKNVQPDKLFEPEHCAEMLVSVMERVLADPKAMTGRLYDYSATPIEW